MIPLIETPRLCLRPFELSDAKRVQELAGDSRVSATTLNIPHPYPDGLAEEWIAKHPKMAEDHHYTWAICLRATDELMGGINAMVNTRHARAELGYWLGFEFWNKGIMSEAVQAVMDWGFAQLTLHRIEASCHIENPGSYRVMEKCGMRREGLLRGYLRKNGEFRDLYIYAIIKE
jgi:RimJ/RimL family protein N-acetyltransferase